MSAELAEFLTRLNQLSGLRFEGVDRVDPSVLDLTTRKTLNPQEKPLIRWTFHGEFEKGDSFKVYLSCHDPKERGAMRLEIVRRFSDGRHVWSFGSASPTASREEIGPLKAARTRRLSSEEKILLRHSVWRILPTLNHFPIGSLQETPEELVHMARVRLLQWLSP